jgi:hypothetical protein
MTVRGATRSLPQAYTYVSPGLASRYGNVNVGRGDREDVLLINAVSGDSTTRELLVPVGHSIDAVMIAPSSRVEAHFVLYMWGRAPNELTRTLLPRGLGAMALAPPFAGGVPHAIWNNVGVLKLEATVWPASTLREITTPSIGA